VTLNALFPRTGWRLFALALIATVIVYWPGLYGSWLFDDYPNIVDNHGVQPAQGDLPSLIGAALSSPASDFKRPLASLSFAANYLAAGLDPFWMKATNLIIHLLNGLLVFLLARALLQINADDRGKQQVGNIAALIAMAWLLLPINLTSVLYVVQRMESMANLFVLFGMLGYVVGRQRMLEHPERIGGLLLSIASLIVPTAIGVLAKETAVMLPLYALLVEWLVFRFRGALPGRIDRRIVALFVIVLLLPMIVGLGWLVPRLLRPESWATRDFTMGTRLLTEMRIVVDYIGWTVVPLPRSLSFYHDDYVVSSGLLSPWTTLTSGLCLIVLIGLMFWLRKRRPLAALGIALFLGCQVLTGTILPLELVYEHRNYFASFGLMLALFSLPWPGGSFVGATSVATVTSHVATEVAPTSGFEWRGLVFGFMLGCLMLWWTGMTAMSAYAWGEPLRLSQALAERGPDSPRAQYELGRTYIIYSHYEPGSPYTKAAYAPLERAAALPKSSILPQQALIFMNSRMDLPLKDAWWNSMTAKLAALRPGVQDESSLAALVDCARHDDCDLPKDKMQAAFEAAMSHPEPSPRLMSTYADYAWNVMDQRELGARLQTQAVNGSPQEPAYLITLTRMLVAQHKFDEARTRLTQLEGLNLGGHLDSQLKSLRRQVEVAAAASSTPKPS
jgi:protein O-mannosyl-transferase